MKGWLKFLGGCGCIGGILTVLVVYSAYKRMSQSFTMDPQKVRVISGHILPGSEPPADFVGEMGMEMTDQMSQAHFRDKKVGLSIMLMMMPKAEGLRDRKAYETSLRDAFSQQNQNRLGREVSQKEVVLEVGGHNIKCSETTTETGVSGVRVRQYVILVRNPDNQRPVGIFLIGSKKEFPESQMRAYLHGLKVELLEGSSTDATPTQDGTTEVTPTQDSTTEETPTPVEQATATP